MFDKLTYKFNIDQSIEHSTDIPILWLYGRSSISFEPECLKWQIYLLFNNINFSLKTINEPKASPNNKLPLLELPHKPGQRAVLLKDDEIRKYVENIQDIPEADTTELDILELVEKQLRSSFLTYFFFMPSTSEQASKLYFPESNDTALVSVQRSHKFSRLKAALSVEIAKVVNGTDKLENASTTLTSLILSRYFPSDMPYESVQIDVDVVDRIAASTLATLSSKLGSNTWILGKDKPSFADATLFAYLYLTLSLLPPSSHLRRRLTGHINLTHYTQHIASDYLKARI
ncbi:hypothetical protein E3Q22_00753 [Wallemia mellicola]|uniref:Metaxin glutathione S-transferase domain-containing protein n=1 Tax=Wallemia mellicola TaxID=1708541 RepID=A0A4T0NV64_9BASI|nr:hypothetical protein E3Q23_00484 [Wallemia mellicola]TIB81765.1 hypothetical protein E3Q22_00753 [Wallemia mellicola]TIB93477.1 hypothetical protein E3Q19_01131 [Wallemia mellicola]TIC01450.1 hypothetical protein E3Q18_00656 [Wallemia mellicola]TIC15351.1 hypothetical protein E3Q14_00390 [Wallemia mellicola]